MTTPKSSTQTVVLAVKAKTRDKTDPEGAHVFINAALLTSQAGLAGRKVLQILERARLEIEGTLHESIEPEPPVTASAPCSSSSYRKPPDDEDDGDEGTTASTPEKETPKKDKDDSSKSSSSGKKKSDRCEQARLNRRKQEEKVLNLLRGWIIDLRTNKETANKLIAGLRDEATLCREERGQELIDVSRSVLLGLCRLSNPTGFLRLGFPKKKSLPILEKFFGKCILHIANDFCADRHYSYWCRMERKGVPGNSSDVTRKGFDAFTIAQIHTALEKCHPGKLTYEPEAPKKSPKKIAKKK